MILGNGKVTDAVECANLVERRGAFELFVYMDCKTPMFSLRCQETKEQFAFGQFDEKTLKAYLAARKELWGKPNA